MSTTLTAVSDPVQAHNLWKAGLLVNEYGAAWNGYDRYNADACNPNSAAFLSYKHDWFICIEE